MIESFQNPKIKNLVRLSTDNRFRRKSGVFVVEGKQENLRALKFGYEPEAFFVAPAILNEDWNHKEVNFVTAAVYEKVAYRGTTEGIIGIYKEKHHKLSDLELAGTDAFIIIEGTEKPGNLGAIIRSCEAFGIKALIVTDPKADFYNPNVIRSSVGCLFGMNIYAASNEETLNYLNNNKIPLFTTFMSRDAEHLHKKNLTGKTALMFGTEHSGLSSFWLNKGENVLIPMVGTIDSLNLSNAVAIGCYEILRQKI